MLFIDEADAFLRRGRAGTGAMSEDSRNVSCRFKERGLCGLKMNKSTITATTSSSSNNKNNRDNDKKVEVEEVEEEEEEEEEEWESEEEEE